MRKIFTSLMALLAMLLVVQSVTALTYTVTVPAGTKACYITGEMNNWSPSATRMTMVNETTYTVDLPNATETMKYQYLSGPDWAYIEKTADGGSVTDRTWSANDVVTNWASVFTPDEREVTIEVLVPNEVKVLYLVGSFNGWQSPSEDYKMTLDSETVDGKIFSIKVFSVDAINMQFKFVAGPAWSYEQTDPKDNFIYGTTENSTAVVVNTFAAYYDPEKTGTITITATVPAGTQQVFIQGDFLGWNMDNALEGVKNQDGTFTFTIPMVMKIFYNFYNKADWTYVEAGADGEKYPDRSATYPQDANISVNVIAWKQTVSGIRDIEEAHNTIYSQDQLLVIEDVKSRVEVFDLSGRVIENNSVSGTFKSNQLSKGVYIVRVDGATKKVVVR